MGVWCFLPYFLKMTALIQDMAAHAGFETPFSNSSGLFSTQFKYANTIHADNATESLSILCLIHDNDI
jgi:hypothetical protein